MFNHFQISGLAKDTFQRHFAATDAALAEIGAVRLIADANPCYPCRVSLQDAEIGETIILLPHTHLPERSPYHASGPVFVREAAVEAQLEIDEIPVLLRHRQISLRAYDSAHMMVEAFVCIGHDIEAQIQRMLSNPHVVYLHLHYALPGCFACRVDRVV